MHSLLVFDSGIGGLSVAEHLKRDIPNCQLHYVADHAAYPYGDKEDEWLIKRVNQLVAHLVKSIQPDILIVACNTASTLALPSLRSHLSIPVVGVVPAIKTAAQLSPKKHIGLLATPGTVSRTYIDDLVAEFAQGCIVDRLGTTELVHLAEAKLSGQSVDILRLKTATQSLMDTGVDTVVLGCTHFPLLAEELTTLYPDIQFVDSGAAIARRTQTLLAHAESKITSLVNQHVFYTTGTLNQGLRQQLPTLGFSQFAELSFPISSTA